MPPDYPVKDVLFLLIKINIIALVVFFHQGIKPAVEFFQWYRTLVEREAVAHCRNELEEMHLVDFFLTVSSSFIMRSVKDSMKSSVSQAGREPPNMRST